jgi:hypothetical protein
MPFTGNSGPEILDPNSGPEFLVLYQLGRPSGKVVRSKSMALRGDCGAAEVMEERALAVNRERHLAG